MVQHGLRYGVCASHGVVYDTVHGLMVAAMERALGRYIIMGRLMRHVMVDHGRSWVGLWSNMINQGLTHARRWHSAWVGPYVVQLMYTRAHPHPQS